MITFHRLSAAIVAAAAAVSLAACGSSGSGGSGQVADNPTFPAGTTMAKLAEAKKVTVGTKFDQPLFGLKGLSGEPEGFDVEIAKIVAAGLGIDSDGITFIETPSKVRDEYIVQGKVDYIVATYAITDERRKRITFGGPYYVAGSKIMVKSDNTAITGPDSFQSNPSAKVCTAAGAIDAEALKPKLVAPSQMVQFDVFSKCADALRTGQVDAVAADSVTLLGLTYTSEGQFKIVGDAFFDQPFGIGMTKGDVEFCKFVNEQLRAAYDDGRYAEAWKDTAGTADETVPTLPELGPCE
jgi:glutamate transport system substrate-binding protein